MQKEFKKELNRIDADVNPNDNDEGGGGEVIAGGSGDNTLAENIKKEKNKLTMLLDNETKVVIVPE
jgi:hypothetical protein